MSLMLKSGELKMRTHILSIALEDYFQGPAFAKVVSRTRWGRLEPRFEQTCSRVLEKLDSVESSATFFVQSWVARSCPDLLQEVVRRGHEVALAGQRGMSFRGLSQATLREQVRRDRDAVEYACQRRVYGFRASDVFLGPSDLWALEVLAEEGFVYDSSLSPFLRAFAAEPWRQFVHENRFASGSLWEIPLTSARVGGIMIPVAGGNYFRQYPEWVVRRMLRRWTEHCEHPLVLYFRLWDFDPLQPRLQTGSHWRDFRHYRNSDRIVATLTDLLSEFPFTSIAKHLRLEQQPAVLPAKQDYTAIASPVRRSVKDLLPISIIVPCFNEEAGIAYLARSLRELKEQLNNTYDVRFILVDDGSKDQTWATLNRHFPDRTEALLLRHAQNRGVSAAILTGLEHAREVACSIDCDCSYDPNELKPMLALLGDGVDLVTASPYHPSGSVRNVPQWRLFLSSCACSLYRFATGRKLYTFTACMRVYRRSSALSVKVKNPGFLGVAELLSRLALDGKQIAEHPATLEVRIFGQSKMKVARNIFDHLGLLSELTRIRISRMRERSSKRRPHPDTQNTPVNTKKAATVVTEVEL